MLCFSSGLMTFFLDLWLLPGSYGDRRPHGTHRYLVNKMTNLSQCEQSWNHIRFNEKLTKHLVKVVFSRFGRENLHIISLRGFDGYFFFLSFFKDRLWVPPLTVSKSRWKTFTPTAGISLGYMDPDIRALDAVTWIGVIWLRLRLVT